MPVVADGGTVTLPLHRTADVVIGAADGVQRSTLVVDDEDVAVVTLVAPDEFTVTPLAKGSTTLRGAADGDVQSGTLPLTWAATLACVETVAQSLIVDLYVDQETPLRLPTQASETEIPLNLLAQIRIRAIGKSGDEVTLDPATIAWSSGNEPKFTLTTNPTNPQHGDLTPLAEFAFVSWGFVAAKDSSDPGGATIAAGGVVSITGDASLALVVEVDVV